jgi:hypothetical protein
VVRAHPRTAAATSAFIAESPRVLYWLRAPQLGLLNKHGYTRYAVSNAGVDDYYVRPEYWDESLLAKPWRVHPPGTFGC